MKNHAAHMLNALVYDGPNRLKKAWLGFLATYTYTRAHDGMIANEHGERISFGRWYSFCCAVRCGWRYLWPR